MQLMSAALDIYAHIFSSILEKNQQQNLLDQLSPAQRPEVEDALKHLQWKMDTMKKILRQMNQEREEVMAKLKTIEVRTVPPQAGFHQPHIHLLPLVSFFERIF